MKLFLSLMFSAAAMIAQTPVTVTNSPAQSVPITGYVAATTTEDIEPAQIKLVALYSYSDVAPKAAFNIPSLRRFHLQQITAHCSSWAAITQDFSLRLGTGANDPFAWFVVNAKTFTAPNAGLSLLGWTSMPFGGVLESGPIWVDGMRTQANGFDSACTVMLLGYYTKVLPQIAK